VYHYSVDISARLQGNTLGSASHLKPQVSIPQKLALLSRSHSFFFVLIVVLLNPLGVDILVEPLRATLQTKVKANSVKQEFEKQDELKRSALRAVAALLSIPDSGKWLR